MKSRSILSTLFLLPIVGFGHPVSYQGSLSIMGTHQDNMAEVESFYSLSQRYAVGGQFIQEQTERGPERKGFARANMLLYRQNNPESQANFYLSTGFGGGKFEGTDSPGYLLGLQADAETRKYYSLFKYHVSGPTSHSIKNGDHHFTARLGVAPYLAEYEELNSWFIVQADYHSPEKGVFTITPLIRLFYKSALIEIGYSLDNKPLFSYMVHL